MNSMSVIGLVLSLTSIVLAVISIITRYFGG